MKLNLKTIQPETPTEAALVAYAKFLERKVQELRADVGRDPRFIMSPVTAKVVDASQIDRYWYDGIALCGVMPHEDGHMLRVESKPVKGDKSYKVGIFINRGTCFSMARTGNAMYDLYKEGLHHIAKMYEQKG